MKKIILIFFIINSFLFANSIKDKTEEYYYYLNNSGLKNIEFHNNFIKLTFNDNKIYCENNTTITDNCNFMFNKNIIKQKSKILSFLKNIISIKNAIHYAKNSNTFLFISEKYFFNKITELNKLKNIFNIIIIPTSNTINSNLIKLNKDSANKIKNYYKKYNFKLPATIIYSLKK